jgi:hypothetical protein
MRPAQFLSILVVLVMVTGIIPVEVAKATGEVDPPSITLEQPVHFLTPDGSDVVIQPGTYEAEATQEWIRLIPDERRNAILLEALPTTHEEVISSPIGLSLPPGEGENTDVHHLLMLLPDGSGLDAIGTYSGIRSKGLLSKVTPPRITQALQKAKTTVQSAAQQVTQALPPTLLTAANKLRSDLIPLIQCLDAARGHARANLLGYVEQIQKDPGGFSQWMIKDLMDQMQTTFPQAMAPALQMLRNGMNPPPQAGQLIDMAIDSWERLATTHQGARCLVPLLRQYRPALKNAANQLQGNFQTQTKLIFDTHIAPALHEAIGKGLTRILSGQDSGVLLSEEELKAVANGVFAKYLIHQLQQGTTAIQSFTKALGNPASQASSLTQVQRVLNPQAQWPDLFRLELGAEIIRAMGHKYLDSDRPGHGGFLVNEAIGLIQLSEGTVEKVSSAACGLIPEVGAAICAIVEEAVDAVWNQGLVPLIRWGATTALHAGYNQAMDQGKVALQQGKLPGELRASTPAFQSIMNVLSKDLMTHLADTHLKDTRQALDGFQASVLQLANAVHSR